MSSSSQQCFYPNGNPSTGDIPCSSGEGVACCPQGWQCESNGLCYLANEAYYGRYTCTDKSWESNSCPHICTYNNTASGDEAILQCTSGSYCCDTNRPNPGCCDTTDDRFSLAALPIIAGSTGAASSTSDAASTSQATSTTSTTSRSSTSSSSSSSATSSTEVSSTSKTQTTSSTTGTSTDQGSQSSTFSTSISVITSSTNDNNGPTTVITSITIPVTVPASATESTAPVSSNHPQSLGHVLGPAIGVPVAALVLVALLLSLFFRRRRNRNSKATHPSFEKRPTSLVPMYPEQKPPSPQPSNPELEGSPAIAKDANVEPGTARSWSTAPPSYPGSPRSPDPRVNRDTITSELAGSSSVIAPPRTPELEGSTGPMGKGGGGAPQRLSELGGSEASDTKRPPTVGLGVRT